MNSSPSVNSSSSSNNATTTSSSDNRVRDDDTSTSSTRQQPRSPEELREQGRAFRDLLAGKGGSSGTLTPRELADLAAKASGAKPFELPPAAASGRDEFWRLTGDARHDNPDAAVMATVHHVVEQGPTPQAVTTAGAPDMTFAELVEKHIRRALATERVASTSGGEVRIELTDAVLPGMALSLRRTTAGWQLVASGKNPQSRDTLQEFAPALVARFERSSLGKLDISLEA